jgi:hypothetical protein
VRTPAESAMPLQWQATVSGNAELKLSNTSAGRVPALRMDFDFKGAKGFVVARCEFKRAMPSEYAVRFRLRGHGPVNNLELKLVDDSGLNVWRYVEKDLRLPTRWKRITVQSRQIDFAWGPSSGRGIAQLGFIEFAIVAGEGGKGTMWLAELQIEDLAPAQAPEVSASSAQIGFDAEAALVGPGWTPRPDDRRPWIVIDSTQPRTLGGLIIDWLGAAPASGFRVRASNSGRRWKTVYSAERAGGKRSYVYLPDLKTRFLKLDMSEPSAGAVVRLQSFEFSRSIEAFWYTIASSEARGWHPRWLHREQSEWTPIGISNGTHCALMNTDGMVEVGEGSFSIEPMLRINNRLRTWTDIVPRQELVSGWIPVPSAIWETHDWRLSIRAEASESGELRVHYRLENLSDAALSARLFVLVRPFQVTPPWQSFRNLGGVSKVHDLLWSEGALRVNETTLIAPDASPSGFAALRFDDGLIASVLESGTLPANTEVHDPFGFAAGALEFELSLEAHNSGERVLSCLPLASTRRADSPAFDWASKLRTAQWAGNGWITEAIHAALTATAQVLITRSGPALQPGPRRYTRSWIRDGAMMSAALLRMGHTDEVREFIRWYAPHQRADGFVPCCVDREGVDWLVEHDSHGELLALMGDYYRFTGDKNFLEESWIFIERAVQCIESLLGADGLLPISVSHEGYLAQPVHSYWDDFWALRGLRDAVNIAGELGREASAERWAALTTRLAASLFASIETTRAQRKLDFIPGSIEWADFDPTATANAIYLLDVPEGLNRKAVERTFDAYLADWRARRSGALPSPSYTPYEIRIIGALVRLGRRDAALELLRFFLSDRRPIPWNQWPEIAWRDRKAPAHVGDLPHTWIAAEYVLALRSMFAYEREADHSLILAAGLAPEWIAGSGVQVTGMPTLYGALSYSLQRVDSQTLRFDIRTELEAPVILRPPLLAPLRSVTVNGAPVSISDGDSATVLHTPAEVICIA